MNTDEATMYLREIFSADLATLHDNAYKTLKDLITERGTYASEEDGWSGPYHSWFGRDSAITADLTCAALTLGGDRAIVERARHALLAFAQWQGKEDNKATGEERGKFPHEIRNHFSEIDKAQHGAHTNQEPWYVDPRDGYLKNWDSVDSTPLWIIALIRVYTALNLSYEPEVITILYQGLEWILRNLATFDGLVGFIGADLQPNRVYSGLHNQGWKDTFQVYQNPDGTLAPQPIKDVLVNAEAWAALRYAEKIFKEHDIAFASKLRRHADLLKERFNDQERGFLLPNRDYFAQAIDGEGRQLPQLSADVAMALWANVDGECIVDDPYIDMIVEKITRPIFFNPKAGIRDYALGTVFTQGTRYHGSTSTFWPFVSALIARGVEYAGYGKEATEIIQGYLNAILQLDSNIEMFIETSDHRLMPWHHPEVGQQSANQQAWTAAAVYYGTLYLLRSL